MAISKRFSTRKGSHGETTKIPVEVLRAKAHVGLFSRVSAQLKCTSSHVTQVANGTRVSPRILEGIVQEVRRIDAELAKRVSA